MGGLVFGEPSNCLDTNLKTGLKNGVRAIGTRDKRNMLLRSYTFISQIIAEPDFEAGWKQKMKEIFRILFYWVKE